MPSLAVIVYRVIYWNPPRHEAQGFAQRILGAREWADVLAGLKSAFLLRVDVFRGEENVWDGGVLQMVQKYSDYNEEI